MKGSERAEKEVKKMGGREVGKRKDSTALQ